MHTLYLAPSHARLGSTQPYIFIFIFPKIITSPFEEERSSDMSSSDSQQPGIPHGIGSLLLSK